MSYGLCFWILMLLWLVFGLATNWPRPGQPVNRWGLGGTVVLFILILLLGWEAFGPAIHK